MYSVRESMSMRETRVCCRHTTRVCALTQCVYVRACKYSCTCVHASTKTNSIGQHALMHEENASVECVCCEFVCLVEFSLAVKVLSAYRVDVDNCNGNRQRGMMQEDDANAKCVLSATMLRACSRVH